MRRMMGCLAGVLLYVGEVWRLYFCLQDPDTPWIGDLRDWEYVNFRLDLDHFR